MKLDKSTLNNTIFMIDDDEEILDSLKVYFNLLDFKTQTFLSAVDYLEQLDDTPGCLICDIFMPDMTGLELLSELNKREHLRPVVFMTGMATIEMAVDAMRLGAADFVAKPTSTDALLDKVLNAIEQFKPSLMAVNDYKTLTLKERQVFNLIIKGTVNEDTAERLYMPLSTVEEHRSSVMKKMQVDSMTQLMAKLSNLKPLGLALECNHV